MPHKCPRCLYSTRYKTHIIEHLQKKNQCNPTFSDESIESILERLTQQKGTHVCHECSKCFSHASGLSRHKKEHTTEMNTNNSHNKSIMTNSTSNINSNNTTATNSYNTTNNNNITTNNTIHVQNLNVFGEEDLSHLLDEILTKRLKEILSASGLSALVKDIHFNDDVPQNMNVKLVKERHPSTMKVWVRDKDNSTEYWKEMYTKEVLDMLIDTKTDLLVEHNNKIIRIAQEEIEKLPSDEKDKAINDLRQTWDIRRQKLNGLKSSVKKKGIYGRVKGNVYAEIRGAKLEDTKN